MLNRLRRLLQARGHAPAHRSDELHRVRVAATALLLEAAFADYECTDNELTHLTTTVRNQFGLAADETDELIAIARRERDEAVDLWQFCNTINRNFSRDEKLAAMESVWRIIYVDSELEHHEDHFAHKLAQLLNLSHSEMIAAKIRARDAMATASADE